MASGSCTVDLVSRLMRSLQPFEIRDQLADLVLGQVDLGHSCARLHVLRLVEPEGEVGGIVREGQGGDALARPEVAEVGTERAGGRGSGDRVTAGARSV